MGITTKKGEDIMSNINKGIALTWVAPYNAFSSEAESCPSTEIMGVSAQVAD